MDLKRKLINYINNYFEISDTNLDINITRTPQNLDGDYSFNLKSDRFLRELNQVLLIECLRDFDFVENIIILDGFVNIKLDFSKIIKSILIHSTINNDDQSYYVYRASCILRRFEEVFPDIDNKFEFSGVEKNIILKYIEHESVESYYLGYINGVELLKICNDELSKVLLISKLVITAQ